MLIFACIAVCVVLSSCRKTEWTKQEVVEWYSRYGTAVRGGLLYRGSDQQWHYFIARVIDDWAFIQIKKEELKLDDERVYSQTSNAPVYFYAVDPSKSFQKIDPKKEANQSSQRNAMARPISVFESRSSRGCYEDTVVKREARWSS